MLPPPAGIGRISFEQVDTNGAGMLTADEILAQGGARMKQRINLMIQKCYANGDGAVTAGEFTAAGASGACTALANRRPSCGIVASRVSRSATGQ